MWPADHRRTAARRTKRSAVSDTNVERCAQLHREDHRRAVPIERAAMESRTPDLDEAKLQAKYALR